MFQTIYCNHLVAISNLFNPMYKIKKQSFVEINVKIINLMMLQINCNKIITYYHKINEFNQVKEYKVS